jgi:hypothetical protein
MDIVEQLRRLADTGPQMYAEVLLLAIKEIEKLRGNNYGVYLH